MMAVSEHEALGGTVGMTTTVTPFPAGTVSGFHALMAAASGAGDFLVTWPCGDHTAILMFDPLPAC